ncbi:hypothetical protein MCOR32_002896 [Pyricularia oryzae]|nr:hypothetical protein MCOR32_002896 [Pyricularia oryzae]
MKLYLLLFAALAAAQVSGGDYDCDATKAKCTSDCQAEGRTVCTDFKSDAKAGDSVNDVGGGCDPVELRNWPIGRDVKAFVPGSVAAHQTSDFDLEVGFIGCAE